jgi:multidrug efflux pump subunit AcrA (membrane-fusion protein)
VEVLILLGCQIYACSREEQNDSSADQNQDVAVQVKIITVEQRDLPETIQSIGTLEAFESVEIRPEIAGIIRQIHFREGKPVNTGDLFCSILQQSCKTLKSPIFRGGLII